jgi:hypothetical protein
VLQSDLVLAKIFEDHAAIGAVLRKELVRKERSQRTGGRGEQKEGGGESTGRRERRQRKERMDWKERRDWRDWRTGGTGGTGGRQRGGREEAEEAEEAEEVKDEWHKLKPVSNHRDFGDTHWEGTTGC